VSFVDFLLFSRRFVLKILEKEIIAENLKKFIIESPVIAEKAFLLLL